MTHHRSQSRCSSGYSGGSWLGCPLFLPLAGLLGLLWAGAPALARPPLFWDLNGPAPGAGGPAPAGMWVPGQTWSPDAAGTVSTFPWMPGSTAIFAAGFDAIGAYPVIVPLATIVPGVEGITFEEGMVTIEGGPGSGLVLTAPFMTTPIPTPHTINVTMSGVVGLVKAGPGILTLGGDNLYTGGTSITGGVLSVVADAKLGAAGFPVTLDGGVLQLTGPIASPRPVTVAGGGGAIDTFGSDSTFMSTFGGPGDFTKLGVGELKLSHVRSNSLSLTGGSLEVSPGAAAGAAGGVSNVTALTLSGGVAPTVVLDITNNGFVVDYAGASPFATIKAQITSGYDAGTWMGDGINSSTAAADGNAIGYAESSALYSVFPADFLGQSVDDTAVLFRYTLYGDANLDGVVNLADFDRLAANFGLATGAVWSQGDFNFSGSVTLADFDLLAGNFGMSASPDGPTPADWAALAAAVPEPASLGVLFSGAIGLLARRRESCVTLPV